MGSNAEYHVASTIDPPRDAQNSDLRPSKFLNLD